MLPDVIHTALKDLGVLPADARILVGISAGPDSVFLANALLGLGFEIGLAHVNYGLRGAESDGDEALVRELASQWNTPLHLLSAPLSNLPPGQSLQQSARQKRYDWYEYLLQKQDYSHIATGHHADDQAETLLWNLLRGNHPKGLRGIPQRRGNIIRPLLAIRKSEILDSLQKSNIPYRSDSSNRSLHYTRNQIRHLLLPAMEQINPATVETLLSYYHRQQQRNQGLDSIARYFLGECLSRDGDSQRLSLANLPQSLDAAAIRVLALTALEDWGLHGHDLWQGLALLDAESGKKLLSDKGALYRTHDGLEWSPNQPLAPAETRMVHREEIPSELQIGTQKVSLRLAAPPWSWGKPGQQLMDMAKIRFPLCIRRWEQGDHIQPLGMSGSKKLSDIFIDAHLSENQKRQVLVVEDQLGIVCLSGFRIAERVRIDDSTKAALSLTFAP